jgi:DNA-directed RNA polymerase sigma subunit (sigma70/sigma32)
MGRIESDITKFLEALKRQEIDIEGPVRNLMTRAEEAMSKLDKREKLVPHLRYGLDDGKIRTRVETGREIRRSPRTVGRIEKSAISKFQEVFKTTS